MFSIASFSHTNFLKFCMAIRYCYLLQPDKTYNISGFPTYDTYLRDPQIERMVHRSQNRVESYHQLRSAIAQVGGKKELTGRTDIEIEISNQCARLIANVIIYYNSAILSRLLTRYEKSGNTKALALITQMSPIAWRHIMMNGHYIFHSDGNVIDLDAIITGLDLG